MNYKSRIIKSCIEDPGWPGISLNLGWGNGYVIIPKNHPFHGLDYDVINDFVNVHGGLTYAELCEESDLKTFDLQEEDIGKWIIGFDTAHAGDNETRWHKAAVQAEADFLLAQVISHCDTKIDLNKYE